MRDFVNSTASSARPDGGPQTALNDAKQKAEDNKKAKDDELAKLKNGTLMSSSITGGVALALQYKAPNTWGEARQTSLAATTLP